MRAKEEFEEIRILLTIKWPFLANLLRRCRIIADSKIETARVTSDNELRVNPEFLAKLDLKGKTFIYLHGVLHLAFYHLLRMKDRDPNSFNIAADCVVNTCLDFPEFAKINFPTPLKMVSPQNLAPLIAKKEEELKNLSVEEIYELLKKQPPTKMPKIMRDLLKRGKQKEEREIPDQNVIQEGDPELYRKEVSEEEVKDYWKEAISRAAVEAKMAGKLPAGIERLIEKILKPKVDWKKIIKKEILNGLGKMLISDWRRRSRKYPGMLPGIKLLTKPTVWFLIDTSGSISDEELQRFFSEIYGILKNQGKGIILPWDVEVYPKIKIDRFSDLLRLVKEKKIFGGGGTIIKKALQKTLKEMQRGDLVVVLTDGKIYDIKDRETQELLRKLASKSIKSIFATIKLEVPLPLSWQKVQIEL